MDQVNPIVDKICPIRTFNIKNYRPDWVTYELLEQIKDSDYFFSKARRTGDEDDWNIAKHLRNLINANIRQARMEFVITELENNESDYNKFLENYKVWTLLSSK